ncbi:two-component system, chemotaxis family, sensor kinase CheA [Marinospirillum celere]|uniref:Chemotaxis protein CheA n=1 Tax=Marinospirillum celere TaxID=1122252 RepID=A0A1I1EM96_9GAMM|nr:hybrid sensor histidine kinase/response regulator [Marinospirillum celere]SFB87786.1 two-component system, chemotaxis family, sensor kinase CheA [Marinospirillum celere]
MALDITKFILRFIDEAQEHLQQLNEGIATLEQQNAGEEQVNQLFRAAHTLKGSSRMLKLTSITETAHAMEDLLSALREGQITFESHHADLLYQGVDSLTGLVDHLAEHKEGASLPEKNTWLCEALTQAAAGQKVDPPLAAEAAQDFAEELDNAPEAKLKTSDTVRIKLNRLDELIKLMGEVVSSHAHMRELVRDSQKIRGQLAQYKEAPVADLDLFNRELRDGVQSQELLMQELHDKALQLRMLPLSTLFDSAGRLVREMARSLGKEVECRVMGSEIELDRQMIDQLADPVIHLLRNALDHGIEPPQEREQKGKPTQGKVTLSAWQDGSWVVIEVRDDGQGISLAAIRDKALRKELMTEEQLDAMSDQEIMDLIFLPGFSTSQMITEISGRGVGMDVVKSSVVDNLQGTLAVHSKPGQGSRFSLRLPLSLAVMRVLLVEAAGQPLGFTAQYVSELVRVPKEALLEVAERNAIILRNEFVPVLYLHELINLPKKPGDPKAAGKELLLLITQVQHEKLALVVDELLDERDLVIKQLPEHLRHQPMISGMVTTGHNELVSLLHVPQLLEMSRKTRLVSSSRLQDKQAGKRVLVVDDSLNTREIEKDVLEAYGYQVTLAENGQEGLEKALLEDFDAILTDVEMPVMDGFTLTARLRELESYRDKPIIIITSREKESDRRRGIEVGADAYIVKGSFDQNSLVETLRALLG